VNQAAVGCLSVWFVCCVHWYESISVCACGRVPPQAMEAAATTTLPRPKRDSSLRLELAVASAAAALVDDRYGHNIEVLQLQLRGVDLRLGADTSSDVALSSTLASVSGTLEVGLRVGAGTAATCSRSWLQECTWQRLAVCVPFCMPNSTDRIPSGFGDGAVRCARAP
jgi:hypothetical protein